MGSQHWQLECIYIILNRDLGIKKTAVSSKYTKWKPFFYRSLIKNQPLKSALETHSLPTLPSIHMTRVTG